MAKAPASGESLYFPGAKEGAGSLDEGKASAVESARSQAAQYIGVEISAEHRDVMSTEEAENMARDTVRSRANAMLRSAEVADVYYEKISREVGAGTVDRYDVWVLLKLPRAEVEKERERQAQEAQQAATAAAARFREGRALEAQGDLIGALVRYRDAVAKTKDLAGSDAHRRSRARDRQSRWRRRPRTRRPPPAARPGGRSSSHRTGWRAPWRRLSPGRALPPRCPQGPARAPRWPRRKRRARRG